MLKSQAQDETGICAQSNKDLDHTLFQSGESKKAYNNNMETHPDEFNTGKPVRSVYLRFLL